MSVEAVGVWRHGGMTSEKPRRAWLGGGALSAARVPRDSAMALVGATAEATRHRLIMRLLDVARKRHGRIRVAKEEAG